MMRRLFWMSALVALSGWGCSSSTQQSDPANAGGSTGSSGATSTGASAGHSNAGTSGHSSVGAGGLGSGSNGGGSSTAGNSSEGGTSSTAGGSPSSTAGSTSTGTTQCDNGIDDDGDGFIDGFDAECTGPMDNDEGTFATGIPGDNRDPKWQDCFFDGNSGAGDDNCRYATGCLTGDLPATDSDCKLTDACVKFCAPLTQNGCDCFGCCTVLKPDGSTVDIAEAASCSLANLDDTKACPRCVKNTQCGNTCGECELCPGKTVADLPASCTPPAGTGGAPGSGGAPNVNAGGTTGLGGAPGMGGAPGTGGTGGVTWNCDGAQTCGPDLPACTGSGFYCSFGCCIPSIR